MTARKFSLRTAASFRPVWPLAFFLLAVLAACTGSEPESEQLAALRSERADLRRRFSAVQDGIRRTQAAALDAPGVRTAQDSFYALLRREMVSNDPAAADLLERSLRIGTDLERVSGPVLTTPDQADERVASESEREAVADELAVTERELRPHVDRAMRAPNVAAAFKALQDSLTLAMARIDPNSASSIERLNELAEEMRQIEIEIVQLERER
ncbi:MAG: hypothetical protein P8049_04725 [Gemmatimonadota bacterium]